MLKSIVDGPFYMVTLCVPYYLIKNMNATAT